jgi:putative transposase
MTRLARFVVPGAPHHVVQRGVHDEVLFSSDEDFKHYGGLLAEGCRRAGVTVWAYCLMPSYIQLLLQPATAEGLARALGETHRRYAAHVNARTGSKGHLFHGRFTSVPVDETYALAAARQLSLAPLAGGLVDHAEDWFWSSTYAHLHGEDDGLVTVRPLLERVRDFEAFLAEPHDLQMLAAIAAAETIGRPLGSPTFRANVARLLNRQVEPRKRGRKPRVNLIPAAHASGLSGDSHA